MAFSELYEDNFFAKKALEEENAVLHEVILELLPDWKTCVRYFDPNLERVRGMLEKYKK